jgi:prefoldin subunit 5
MTDPAKDVDPLDADACIDIATVIIDELDAIIATLEEELARVRQERDALRSENLRLHGKLAAGEFEHIALSVSVTK